MLLTSIYSTFAIILPSIILIIAFITSARSYMDREKSSPFECGFDPKTMARLPFSLRFFLLAVLFLVFDIEIILLLPSPMIISYYMQHMYLLPLTLFLLILLLGLIHEWNEGSLDWSN